MQVMGVDGLKVIATELALNVRKSASRWPACGQVDWSGMAFVTVKDASRSRPRRKAGPT